MRFREQLALKMKYCKTLCYTAQRKRRLAAMSMLSQDHRVERDIVRTSFMLLVHRYLMEGQGMIGIFGLGSG